MLVATKLAVGHISRQYGRPLLCSNVRLFLRESRLSRCSTFVHTFPGPQEWLKSMALRLDCAITHLLQIAVPLLVPWPCKEGARSCGQVRSQIPSKNRDPLASVRPFKLPNLGKGFKVTHKGHTSNL